MDQLTGSKTVSLSYKETDQLADKVIHLLRSEGAAMGYGIVSCMLVVARLTMEEVNQEKEIAFIKDLSEWVGVYFTKES